MSMIEKQIDELIEITEELDNNGELDMDILSIAKEWSNKIHGAIDTIKSLSAKMSAMNLNGGWIPVGVALPNHHNNILICTEDGYVNSAYYSSKGYFLDMNSFGYKDVVAWMELPKPYNQGE